MDRENVFLAVQGIFSGTSPQKAAADVEKRLDAWRKSAPNDVKNFKDWSGS
jgi:N-acetylmuramoyl-L-alanine amidase CwlA